MCCGVCACEVLVLCEQINVKERFVNLCSMVSWKDEWRRWDVDKPAGYLDAWTHTVAQKCAGESANIVGCFKKFKKSPPNDVPRTRVGQESMRAVRPFRKIWWRKSTVSALRKMELMSSWVHGGFLLLAAILKGLKKQDIKISSCSTYSSSASTIRNTKLKANKKPINV